MWHGGGLRLLDRRPGEAARTLDDHLASTAAEWILFWDPLLGDPDPTVISRLVLGRADAWHAGLASGLAALPEEHDYIHPIWPLARDAGTDLEAVSWRVGMGSLLVRADVLRDLGGIDQAQDGLTGVGLELGRRLIERGAVVMHTPSLVPGARLPAEPLSEHDRFVFLRRTFGRKWVRYAALRRALETKRPWRVRRGLSSSARAVARHERPSGRNEVVERPAVDLPERPRISVVLPTLGRYEMVDEVLDQLAAQTIRPYEVVVVDQNDPADRDHALYERHATQIPLQVVFQSERGQWVARNEAVRRTTGDWVAFVDDDSTLVADFLERHLEGLLRYDADLTTGASIAVVGAPVPENYAFFRVADQWDSGNGLCHRSLLERFGLFDQQFDRQRRGDAEFGLRVQLGGGLVMHVPGAIRTHLKAESGGLRTFGSWDGFRLGARIGPLPLPSMIYYTRRYHTPRQVREDLLIGLSQAIVPYALKRRASGRQWAGFVATELLHVPSTIQRVRLARRLADRMVDEGPRIPVLSPR